MDGELRPCQPVVGKLPIPVDLYEPRPVQVAQVARDGRLGCLEEIDQIADAELAGDEQIENPNPGRVGEATEEKIEIGNRIRRLRRHGSSRISLGGFNLAKRM